MVRHAGSWRYGAGLSAGFLVLGIGLLLVAVTLRSKGGMAAGVNVAALVSFALGIVPWGRSLLSWWRTKMTAPAVTS